jgi:Cu/Zn superoxide dismutase
MLLAAAAVVATVAVMTMTGTSQARPVVARATLVDINGNAVGEAEFSARRDGSVLARAKVWIDNAVTANPADFHGFHIHANNDDDTLDGDTNDGCITFAPGSEPDPTAWFVQVDSHWETGTDAHGSHTGDLPVLLRQSDGEAEITFVVDKFAAGELPGKALIAHFLADDFGKHSGIGTSTTTGNAGSRYACGLIEAVATS